MNNIGSFNNRLPLKKTIKPQSNNKEAGKNVAFSGAGTTALAVRCLPYKCLPATQVIDVPAVLYATVPKPIIYKPFNMLKHTIMKHGKDPNKNYDPLDEEKISALTDKLFIKKAVDTSRSSITKESKTNSKTPVCIERALKHQGPKISANRLLAKMEIEDVAKLVKETNSLDDVKKAIPFGTEQVRANNFGSYIEQVKDDAKEFREILKLSMDNPEARKDLTSHLEKSPETFGKIINNVSKDKDTTVAFFDLMDKDKEGFGHSVEVFLKDKKNVEITRALFKKADTDKFYKDQLMRRAPKFAPYGLIKHIFLPNG